MLIARRSWLVVGKLLAASCLLFTCWTLLIAFHAYLVVRHGREWWVENRTTEPLWVTPFGIGDRGSVRLPHYPERMPKYSTPPFGEVLVHTGERRLLVIDGAAQADLGGRGLLGIRSAAGEYRRVAEEPGSDFLIDNLSLLPRADAAEIAELNSPPGLMKLTHGIPVWVIIILGVAAPVALWRLGRIPRAQATKPTENHRGAKP